MLAHAPRQAVLWGLPLVLPLLGLLAGGREASERAHHIFWAGIALQSILLLMVARRSLRTQSCRDDSRKRVLHSTWLLIVEIGIMTALLIRQSEWVWWLVLTPLAFWILTVFYWPFLTDSAIVLQAEPRTGWLRIFGLRLAFKDPTCPALWVRLGGFDLGSIGYTPNLGHPWGPFVLAVFLILVAAMMPLAFLAA